MNKMVYRLMSVIVAFALMFGDYYSAGASSSTYYVSMTGNDANPGSQALPWRTIQKAANTMIAGDTVNVLAGDYTANGVVQLKKTGSSGNPITYQAQGKAIVKGFNFGSDGKYSYIHIKGFDITSNYTENGNNSNASIFMTGSNNVIEGNYIYHGGYGILVYSYTPYAEHNTHDNKILNNKIERSVGHGIFIHGYNNLIEGNSISGLLECYPPTGTRCQGGADGIHFQGSGNVFRNNHIEITMYGPVGINPEVDDFIDNAHLDCFQTWDTAGYAEAGSNTLFEGNFCDNLQYPYPDQTLSGQGWMMSGNVDNITFRNNVVRAHRAINTNDVASSATRRSHLYIYNNTFINNLSVGANEWSGIDLANAPYTIAKNNIFYDQKHTTFDIHGDTTGIVVDYNLVYNTDGSLPSYLPYAQLHELRGVNPKFVNPSAKDYHLQSGSPACTGGENGTYIGAFPCVQPVTITPVPATQTATARTQTPTITPIPPSKTPTITATNTPTKTLTVAATNTPTNIPTYTPFPPTPVPASPTPTLLPLPTSTPVQPTATQISVPTATSIATLQPASPTLSPAIPTTAPTGMNSVDVRVVKGENDVEESLWGRVSINSNDLELVNNGGAQKVGMRFMGVSIPQGATIVNAYIQFKVGKTSTNSTTLSIQGDASANAPAFTSTARNISSRPRTTGIVNWSPSSWSTIGAVGSAQLTPNLAPIIQEIVGQPGWAPGNSMVIIITGNGKRVAKAYEGDAAGAPLLHIEYTTNTVVYNMPARLAMAAIVSTELPTALPTTATPVPTLTATFQPPSPTIPVTFTSTVSPAPLLLPSLTPTSLAPVLPTFTPTAESINTMDIVTMDVVNQHPVITSNGILSIAENTTAVTTVTATDADLPAQPLTYSITGGTDLALFSINSSTGELTFNAAPDFEVPADAGVDNIYNVTVQASDGELTATQDIVVTLTALNDNNPVITSNGVLSIAENAMAVATVTATDADLPAQALTYSIAGGADSALFSINSSTGELTLITAPDFEAPADAGVDNIYNVTVQASDGELTATQDIAVTLTALNDNNPVITSNGVLSIAENTTVVTTVTATDADLPAQSLTYSIAGGPDSALFSINSSTGELTFITAPNFEVPADAGVDNIYNVTVQASDGNLTATQDVAITVTAVNDNNPVITSNGILSIAENTMAVTTVTATDADLPAQSLTYSIAGGADSALFSINSSTGELTFNAAPDFEVPADAGVDNIYNVTVQASDGELTVTQDIAVTVTAINDNNPVITSNGSLSIAENITAVAIVTATDADLPTQTLTYSIAGGADSALFSINSSTGELTFITAPDFEVPTDAGVDNIYNVTTQASDGELTVTQDIAITVTPVNDNNPVITSNGVLSIAENTTAVTIVTATDADLPAQALTYSIAGGADSALFSINSSTGELTFIAAPNYEVPIDAGIDNIYTIKVQAFDGELTATQDIAVAVKELTQP